MTKGESGGVAELTAARKDQIDERLLGFCARFDSGGDESGVAGYEAQFSPDVKGADAAVLPQFEGNRASTGSVFAAGDTEAWRRLPGGEVPPGGAAMQAALDVRPGSCGLTLYPRRPMRIISGHARRFGAASAKPRTAMHRCDDSGDGRWHSLWVSGRARAAHRFAQRQCRSAGQTSQRM